MKFVSVNQVARLYNDLAGKILNKLGLREKAEVSSVQIDDISDNEVDGSVTVDYDSVEKSVVFENLDTAELGKVKLMFPTALRRDAEYSLALREDGTQTLHSKTMNSEVFATTNGAKRYLYAFPGANNEAKAMARGSVMSNNTIGGGVVLTTRFRSYEHYWVYLGYSGVPAADIHYVYPNVYSIMDFSELSISEGEQVADGYVFPTVLKLPQEASDGEYQVSGEYWIEVRWTNKSFARRGISINFECETVGGGKVPLKWCGSVPDWTALVGNVVQIRIMNGIASWNIVRTASATPVFSAALAAMMTVAGMGDYQAASDYAGDPDNNYERFQWILDTYDDEGNHIVKPVWFTGGTDGIFIDALGYHITG